MASVQVSTGLRLRPYVGGADLAEVVRLLNAEAAADGLQRRTSLEELGAIYAHPSDAFDPARDVTVAEIDGEVVAVGERETVDTTDGHREYRLDGVVDPAWRRRGIGRALLRESERTARERASVEGHASPILGSFASWVNV